LFSCKSGERAFETPKVGKGHGVFFYHVIEGLKGAAKNKRGEVTWGGLVEHVTDAVSDDVPKLIGGGAKQTPELKVNLTGKSPVLIGPGKEAVVKDRVYDSPQAVFDASEAFGKARNVKRHYACYTSDSLKLQAGLMVAVYFLSKKTTPEDKEGIARMAAKFAKQGLTEEKLDKIRPSHFGLDESNYDNIRFKKKNMKAFRAMSEGIKDRPAFLASWGKDPAASLGFGKDARLADLKIDDDKARGNVRWGSRTWSAIEFVKESGSWKIVWPVMED
jgi:hypothetical protein